MHPEFALQDLRFGAGAVPPNFARDVDSFNASSCVQLEPAWIEHRVNKQAIIFGKMAVLFQGLNEMDQREGAFGLIYISPREQREAKRVRATLWAANERAR